MDPVVRVKNMVRHTLIANPSVTNRELLERAREIAPEAVEGLSLRQFHGKYRLPIMRYEMGEKSRERIRNGSISSDKVEKALRPKSAGARQGSKKTGRSRKSRRSAAHVVDLNVAVRTVLVEFAVALEKAESRSDLVQAVASVDGYVARIVGLVLPPAVDSRTGAPESNGSAAPEPNERLK